MQQGLCDNLIVFRCLTICLLFQETPYCRQYNILWWVVVYIAVVSVCFGYIAVGNSTHKHYDAISLELMSWVALWMGMMGSPVDD